MRTIRTQMPMGRRAAYALPGRQAVRPGFLLRCAIMEGEFNAAREDAYGRMA